MILQTTRTLARTHTYTHTPEWGLMAAAYTPLVAAHVHNAIDPEGLHTNARDHQRSLLCAVDAASCVVTVLQ
jgi:hypothetical protein